MKLYCNARRPMLKGLAVAMLVLPVVAGCGDNEDRSTATLAPAAAADTPADIGIDLDAFAKAWGSGDADQIRTFYTDDAVIEPLGHLLDTLHGDPQAEYWDVSGSDLDREAAQHAGARLEILDAVRVGDVIVDTVRWTFPDGFVGVPDGTVITGGDILHIRDGLIWRQFSDFQIFVNGEPVEI